MATAFSECEKNTIKEQLKDAARKCALTYGVKKTTVEQLTEYAGISKGAFYKFYDSKELLFFELLEDIHSEIYNKAMKVINYNTDDSDAQKVKRTLLYICEEIDNLGVLKFIEVDVPFLLRKIPDEIRKKHYHSDEVHIKELFEKNNLKPSGGIPLAASTVRALLLIIAHKDQIGELYPQVLDTMVSGICIKLFP